MREGVSCLGEYSADRPASFRNVVLGKGHELHLRDLETRLATCPGKKHCTGCTEGIMRRTPWIRGVEKNLRTSEPRGVRVIQHKNVVELEKG